MPQGTHNGGNHGAKQRDDWRSSNGRSRKGDKKKVEKPGHMNKYAQFSKADHAQADLEIRKEQEAKTAAREQAERLGRRRIYW